MDDPAVWIGLAFVLGYLVSARSGLPPLVGFGCQFLTARRLGSRVHRNLGHVADLGVTLMLFWSG